MFTTIVDTTESTAADRIRLYVNGTRLTNITNTNGYPAQNSDLYVNTSGLAHYIGETHHNSADYRLDAYLAEVNFVDGTAAEPSNFGETKDGIWVPKSYSGSYGTNGFYLPFDDSSAIGDDESGNNNDWTANNLAAHDVVPDSPTNNFATWNPIGRMYGTLYSPTTSEGNLKAATAGNSTHVVSTFGIEPSDTQGYYWEVKAISLDTARSYLGILAPEGGASGASIGSYQFYKKFVLNRDGSLFANNDVSATNTVALTSWTTNDILMFAYKDGKFWIGKNGTWMNSGDPAAGTGDLVAQDGGRPSDRGDVTWFPYCGYNSTYTANFGQEGTFAGTETAGGNSDENGVGDFKYSVPSGFLALASSNLPEPTIGPNSSEQADDYFNTVLYTGNGTGQSITGVGFQPDWVWLKTRSVGYQHSLYDSVRGGQYRLASDQTVAEVDNSSANLQSFDADGFTVGTLINDNQNSVTYVSWNWKAGGTAVSNTDGSITSNVSANQDSGFSIVSYEGTGSNATVGHGLSSAPELIIIKERDNANGWAVSIKGDATDFLRLDTTVAQSDDAAVFNDTAPTSTVFSIGTAAMVNRDSMIAYCFHSVEGFSKVGSYVGNGNADGTFVFTGFRPAWLLIKETGNANSWEIYDTKRDPNNVASQRLFPNGTQAEATTSPSLDIVINGFKARAGNTGINRSNGSYIYMAFAEAPFKYANAR